jgi:hypothetical protein
MAETEIKNIFLSASIPTAERNPLYIDTCDITAIRDAIIALASFALKDRRLIWGGHPAITPVISLILQSQKQDVSEHVVLYQSKWFNGSFPVENKNVPTVVLTEKKNTREESLAEMRFRMIGENDFSAAFFIGGMEGVEEEYNLFKKYHPDTPAYPIASTGAAAKKIFDEKKEAFSKDLEENLAYMSLFRSLLETE